MKKSSNLIIVILIAFAGAALIQFGFIAISPALAFFVGSLICSFLLYYISGQSNKTISARDKEEHDSKTLYVGNLPYRANENDVKDLFSDYGEVFSVRLMKDKRTGKRKGFGFVVMAMNDAPHAIEKLNNKEYMDRTLKVREANEPRMQDSD